MEADEAAEISAGAALAGAADAPEHELRVHIAKARQALDELEESLERLPASHPSEAEANVPSPSGRS